MYSKILLIISHWKDVGSNLAIWQMDPEMNTTESILVEVLENAFISPPPPLPLIFFPFPQTFFLYNHFTKAYLESNLIENRMANKIWK